MGKSVRRRWTGDQQEEPDETELRGGERPTALQHQTDENQRRAERVRDPGAVEPGIEIRQSEYSQCADNAKARAAHQEEPTEKLDDLRHA